MDSADGRDTIDRPSAASITAGIVITGDVECAGALQISGRVQGEVRCPTVFVDEGGSVLGGVHAERVRVSGTVEGTIEAGDLAIEPGGRVSGTIGYARLKVTAGGIAEGNLQHRGSEAVQPSGKGEKRRAVEEIAGGNRRSIYVE